MPADHFPSTPEELTADYMTSCFHASGMLADHERVESTRFTELAPGRALLGRLYRLELGYSQGVTGKPPTAVVKLPSGQQRTLQLAEALKAYERELSFYPIRTQTPFETPELYYAAAAGPREFVLIIEDIAEVDSGDQLSGITADQVRLVMPTLAKHHAKFWNKLSPEMASWIPRLDAPHIAGIVKQMSAMGVERLLRDLPEAFNDTTQEVASLYVAKYDALAAALCAEPTTFQHGDFRLDNLLFGKADARRAPVTVVDWQLCYRVRGPYDVAYLLTQSASVDTRREVERDALSLYLEGLRGGGVTEYGKAECEYDYRLATTFCYCYALIMCGALELADERRRALALEVLERANDAIEDVRALELMKNLH